MSAPGPTLSARSEVVAVIGDPIRHSLSPIIHNAGFMAAGLDWVAVAFAVAEGNAAEAVAGVRALGLRGLSVTMPHKRAVIDHLDELTDTARRLDAVNCIVARDGVLVGDNTDSAGFMAGLRADLDFEVAGRRCVVLGAGGAARAVVLALASAGAETVTVVARREAAALDVATLAGPVGAVGDVSVVRGADLVVNATPVGMVGGPPGSPLPAGLVGSDQVVVDLVYRPSTTQLMEQARSAGAATANGVSMLVHQAATAFQVWTQTAAPIEAMRAAAASSVQS